MSDGNINLNEIEEFLKSDDLGGIITDEDADGIIEVIRQLPINQANLTEAMDNHQDLEIAISWYLSKVEAGKILTEAKFESIRGRAALISKQNGNPQWVSTSLINDDQDVKNYVGRFAAVQKLHIFLDGLSKSLKRRETLINNLAFKERQIFKNV